MREHGIKWGGKKFLDLDYAEDLTILDESEIKNEWTFRGFASSGW